MFTRSEEERIITTVLLNNESVNYVVVGKGLLNPGMLRNWIKKYKENGYNIVERKQSRPTMPKITKKKETEVDKEKNQKIIRRKFVFKSGVRIFKKIESRCSNKEESTIE